MDNSADCRDALGCQNDRIDAEKIANLLRGGNLPQAYVYPQGLRETRHLLRRRIVLVHKRAELITHIQTTNAQYNLPPFGQKLIYAKNRQALKIAERFADASVRKTAPRRFARTTESVPVPIDEYEILGVSPAVYGRRLPGRNA